MARQNSHSLTNSHPSQPAEAVRHASIPFDIHQQIEELEKIILECFRIPLTRWTIVDEDRILDQLDIIKDSVPEDIKKARSILEREQQIIADAEAHYQKMVQSAQQRAAELLDQTGIIQQAEMEANRYRQQVQQECEVMQRKTLEEIEQMRQITTQEMSQYREQALAECREIQMGADDYADRSLQHLEQRLGQMVQELGQMVQVVRNGRQQIQGNPPPPDAAKSLPPQLDNKRPKGEGKKVKIDSKK